MPFSSKHRRPRLLLAALLLCAAAAPTPTQAENCTQSSQPATYKPQPGDQANSTTLTAARTLSSPVTLTLNVCAGNLQIIRTRENSPLRLEIHSPGADKSLAAYLHDFKVSPTDALINVSLPSRYHPSVTLYVPESKAPESRLNLGAGNLTVQTDALAGDRQLNLGAGNVVVYLNGDHNYATLSVNIGMGNLDDKLPHGQSSHFIVAKQMQGTGKGDLRINVGVGNVTLKEGEE